MLNHDLIELLRAFSQDEIKNFRNFLNSPYFNRSKKLVKLYNEIIKYHPLFTHKNLEKEKLHKKISGSLEYNDGTFRSLLFDLLKLAEKFLSVENFSSDAFLNADCLLRELSDKRQVELFNKNAEKITKSLESMGLDSNYFLKKYWIDTRRFNFGVLNTKILNHKDIDSNYNYLGYRSIYNTIYFICEIINEYYVNTFLTYEYGDLTSDINIKSIINNVDIKGILKSTPKEFKENFFLNMYYKLYKCFTNWEVYDYYCEYKRTFKKNLNSLSKDEINFHYMKLYNYCMMKIIAKPDSNVFNNELFVIYNEILENKYYLSSKSNYLSIDFYRGILNNALKQKKFKWVKEYIEGYSNLVYPNYRENIFDYGYAKFYNATGDYEKSMHYINRIPTDNHIFKLEVRNLTLFNYYRLGAFEQAISAIDSYKKFLKRNDMVPENKKIRYRNFIVYMEKIILSQLRNKKIDLLFMRQEIESNNDIVFKPFLLEIIDELTGKYKKYI